MAELRDRLQAALGDLYRIEREIGGGGMSRLFLANEASLNRQVVIKLLPPEMTSDVSAARFKQEIELAAQLQHPNVLPVLTAGSQDDLIYYVMPYVTGESLRHRLTSDGRASIEDTRKVLSEVADALAHAHAQGVVHRDIKPENILLQHGHAVLMDFGVARAVAEAQSGERLTATGLAIGTPGYMSPEQAAGERHIDARTDVYALAVVGYEMLTGAPPFTGASVQAVLAAHMTEDPRPLMEVRADTPPDLAATIERALAKQPSDRIQTAAEFRDAVAITSGTTPAVSRTRGGWVLGAGALAVAAAAVFFLWPRGWSVEGDPRQSIVVFPFENRSGDAENDWLQEASMNLLGLSLAHWEDLRVFDDERTASLMRRRDVTTPADLDFDAAQRMAMEANVGTLVIGDVRREGDSLAFEAKVHDVASGNRLATEIVRSGLDADHRFVFDSLAARILQVSGAPPGQRPGVVAQTTHSLDAYREYLVGTELLQTFEIDSAEAHLQRAIALDSTFALAYIQLRNVDGWKPGGGDPAKRSALVGQAQAHGRQLPIRLKTLLEYHVAFTNGQYARARSLAAQMIQRDSGDVEAWYELGEAHFHHGLRVFPHPDTLGNIGTALNAFKTALKLDSSYTLAYLHILDALANCARDGAQLACVGDSAIYATDDDLDSQLGAGVLERLRDEATAEQVTTAYGWVSAAPASVRARERLIQILLAQERFAEAANQTVLMRQMGDEARALAFEGQALFGQRQFREAAARMSEGMAVAHENELDPTSANPVFSSGTMMAGGRTSSALTLFTKFLEVVPDPVPFGPRTSVPTRLLSEYAFPVFLMEVTGDSATAVDAANAYVDALWDEFGRDTVSVRAVLNMTTDFALGVRTYIVSRDTTFLADWLRDFGSDAPPVADAHLQLARGDTAAARKVVAGSAESEPPTSGPEMTWTYARGLLRALIGDLKGAIDTYALLDSASNSALIQNPVPLVRSWAERGALYQQLGETDKAIEMYEKFIDAWSEGDEDALNQVERARAAVAALMGETGQTKRR